METAKSFAHVIFRIAHATPKAQKIVKSPLYKLRLDQMAIVVGVHAPEFSALCLLGVHDFWRVGREVLVACAHICSVHGDVGYNLHCLALPHQAYSASGTTIIKEFVEAESDAQIVRNLQIIDTNLADKLAALQLLCENQFVTDLGQGKFQITNHAFVHQTYSRTLLNHSSFSRVCSHFPFCD